MGTGTALCEIMARRKKRRMSRAERIRRVKRNRRILAAGTAALVIMIVLAVVQPWRTSEAAGSGMMSGGVSGGPGSGNPGTEDPDGNSGEPGMPDLDVQLLTPNEFSRPQIALEQINGIVVHYTGNPGTTAQDNRDYFEGLKDGSNGTFASSHFVIGLDGEIIQCIPSGEISYASNDRNYDTLSIECCHPDESGRFTEETYQSLVELTAWLCVHFDVPVDGVIRHYDVTGKECPKYFVDHEDAWEQFKNDVASEVAQSV